MAEEIQNGGTRKVPKLSHLVLALGVLAFVSVGSFVVMFEAIPVTQRQIGKLEPGMTKEEVQAILGPPTAGGKSMWSYYYSFSWPMLNVYFEKDRLTQYDLDR